MPSQSLHECTYPGCHQLVRGSARCAKHSAKTVERDPVVKKLYNSAQWKSIRVRQLAEHPWCAHCLVKGLHVPATEVHHLERHKGNPVLFYAGPFESLCKPCHSAETAREVGWHE